MTKEVITQIYIKEERCSSKFKLLFLVSLFLFVGSLFAQIFVTNDVAVKGKEIVELDAQRTALEKDISIMQLESSKLSSLKTIQERAYELGFRSNDSYANLINDSVNTASLSSF